MSLPSLHHLEPVVPDAPPPDRPPEAYLPMQHVTREIAFDPASWDEERKQKVRQLFDNLAPEWHTRGGPERLKPTRDALERGGVPDGGIALEIGSGTGIQTPPLVEKFDFVLSLDLSTEMLALAPRLDGASRLRADASVLPVADDSVDVIVCVNAYLFPDEYARVLKKGGQVVFVSTSGERTPIFLPPADVVAAMEPALAGSLKATTSRHGHAIWTVVALSS